jgi:Fe-S oxidoreductase
MTEEVILVDMDLREHFAKNPEFTPAECYQCGTCTATCPVNMVRESKLTIRKLLHQAQMGITPDRLVWQCSSCKLCEVRCPRSVDIVDNIHAIRQHHFKKRMIPKEFEQLLWNVLEEANPAGEPKAMRDNWARDLNIKDASKGGSDVLFFVGGPAAYDPRLQKVAKNFTQIMTGADVNFGILGKIEPTSGEAVKETGETAYLDLLIQKNVEIFNETRVKQIVALSPHAYDVFKRIYPDYGLNAEVVHYTELLHDLWSKDQLKFTNKFETEMTYHDPCFLGRYNGIYDQPRDLMEGIPGVMLLEMTDNRENGICCGGGGNQMYVETEPGERLSDLRVKQAGETGAKNIITSCGYCIQNFEDSVKTTGTNLPVDDLIELIARGMGV